MEDKYDKQIEQCAEEVFESMAPRTSAEDMKRLRRAFEMAREAHAPQRRKTGEPYIFHPIAVAKIAAVELQLDINSVIAAFLHDVVEDTPHNIGEIQRLFGNDVAFLVNAVTKKVSKKYVVSKQMDNFRKMLDAMNHDVRAILVKLADRLHNMRTLASMPADKQMKIAGETDYFYAPLATRLGLYNIKTELENLSLKFRCPHEYNELTDLIEHDRRYQKERLDDFAAKIHDQLRKGGIETVVSVKYHHPYSIWRKMQKYGEDFHHLKYRHFTEIVFSTPPGHTEKEMTLRIYSLLTDRFKEKPGGISNYMDSPKENGYRSFHLKLLADFGRWQEVHISSENMMRQSQTGIPESGTEANVDRWIEKFRGVLSDADTKEPKDFLENVVATFYNDDIMAFTPKGRPVILPQNATVLDFAYEVDPKLGQHAHYAKINSRVASVRTRLHRGDIVEVFTDESCHPHHDWLQCTHTFRARQAIKAWLDAQPPYPYRRCPECHPIPGEEVVGFKDPADEHNITVHKRDCPVAIRLASQYGEEIVSVDYRPTDSRLYHVKIAVRAVDRYHLFIDMATCITETLRLTMHSFNTRTVDGIVDCEITFSVHSFDELQSIIAHISAIPDVDEVRRIVTTPD